MEIEVRQRGGVLGLDRRYLVKDGAIEVTEEGRREGKRRSLEPKQTARIEALAKSVSGAHVDAADDLVSDDMETTVDIRPDGSESTALRLNSGATAPAEVWDLIGEVSKAFHA
jgi:hypothetical protein